MIRLKNGRGTAIAVNPNQILWAESSTIGAIQVMVGHQPMAFQNTLTDLKAQLRAAGVDFILTKNEVAGEVVVVLANVMWIEPNIEDLSSSIIAFAGGLGAHFKTSFGEIEKQLPAAKPGVLLSA